MIGSRAKPIAKLLYVMVHILGITDGKKGVAGVVKCPICSGTLKYSVARTNGHIAASCSSTGCVRFIQ